MRKRIGIVVFDGVEEQDVIGPFEALRVACAFGAPFAVELVALKSPRWITAAFGLRFEVRRPFRPSGSDIVIVPGGGWLSRAPKGAWAEAKKEILPARIAEAHAKGKLIATVCAGAMLAADLLRGRPATTHHQVMRDLRARGARIVGARVVDDGSLVSCGGITAGIDLALHLIDRFAGKRLAMRVARYLEYRRQGPAVQWSGGKCIRWHR